MLPMYDLWLFFMAGLLEVLEKLVPYEYLEPFEIPFLFIALFVVYPLFALSGIALPFVGVYFLVRRYRGR